MKKLALPKIPPAVRRFLPGLAQAAVLIAIVVTAFVAYNAGARHGGNGHAPPADRPGEPARPARDDGDSTIYTCSMHPQIRQDEPGDCPICGMELVPVDEAGEEEASSEADWVPTPAPALADENGEELLGFACAMNCLPPLEEDGPCPICGMEMQPVYEDDDDNGDEERSPRRMTMSTEAVALANVETAVVKRGTATRNVRMVGELAEDPRRRAHISANAGGRIDRLHAEFEGDVVERGQVLAEIYSPELLAVQEELFQALRSRERLGTDAAPGLRESAQAAIRAIRERLILAGLTAEQVDEIIEGGEAREHVILRAPVGGTVTARYVEEGDYIGKEQRLLTVVDFRALWGELEAFESDLTWLRPGQDVSFQSRSFPGRTFDGTIAWMDPVTNPLTRTTRVRIDVDNSDGHLKPGMYLTAIAGAHVDEAEDPLIIPESAPLITGKRAVVYISVVDAERPTFEGREVLLGPRVREGYVVLEGLQEGERVVTRGAFQIDSALQIIARPSMMRPEGGAAMDGHADHGPSPDADHDDHEEHQPRDDDAHEALSSESLGEILPVYLSIQEALAEDEGSEAAGHWPDLLGAVDDAHAHTLHGRLMEADTDDIEAMRLAFEPLSRAVISALEEHGNPMETPLHLVHCPMAFDWEGADWIQAGSEVRNSYFGDTMYRCGTVEKEFAPR